MKITRQKKAHKHLGFYINNYKFREPFQVLIDGTFCFAALTGKFNIQDQLPKYFQAPTKLLTTPCVIIETEKLGQQTHGAMLIVKRFAVHKCGHDKNPTTGSNCLRAMVGKENSSRYIIATQDRDLQNKLRKIPGVPLLYLHGKVPTLDPPSQASKDRAQNQLQRLGFNTQQQETLKALKEKSGLIKEEDTRPKKKKKKGGPNPLSCKKKKKTKPEEVASKNTEASGKIRKRKKIKLASHVIEALKSEIVSKKQDTQ